MFVLGAGNQAAFQIAAMMTLFPGLKKIMVADMLSPENAEKFISNLPKRLKDEFGIDATGKVLEANSNLDLILGKVDGRTSKEQITIYDATGMALLDIAAGKAALDLAAEKNLGTTAEL